MLPTRHGERNLPGTQKIFNAATMTVGGLFLTTHSVAVTLIGAAVGAVITGWTTWLEYNQPRTIAGSGTPVPEAGETASLASDTAGRAYHRQVTAAYPDKPQAH